ncbi:hypothetical protein [Niabella drilacis]|uniref:Uncharacterized protein n=1 Tax=Niabella drilacis (strain DSM 25811 / CCM 8410 / CCUG 62505 / LMG 26954 / E90) TaxID=1285928 RepID=A0A1G6QBH2_NIADE|nr:hypothetical protein [Niabella drilacis]SDC89842.1 hypothetical protein SAMN04487894_104353 [Niabella drilacis]
MKTAILLVCLMAFIQTMAQPAKQRQPVTGRFRVTEAMDTVFHLFKTGDMLDVSLQKGLRHYRNGKLVSTYKIIPATIKVKKVAPCLKPPCPELVHDVPVYYAGALNRYIELDDLSSKSYLYAAPEDYNTQSGQPLREGQWALWYVLKKTGGKSSFIGHGKAR